MAEAAAGFLEQLKSCIVWSWTYLWTVWFFIVLFLVYILRVPLRLNDNLSTGQARRPAAPPPPRKVSASRPGSRPAGTRARGRAASGGRPSPAALAGPPYLEAGGARHRSPPPHPRAGVSGPPPGCPRRAPRAPESVLGVLGGSSIGTAARRRAALSCAARAHAWPGAVGARSGGCGWSRFPEGVAVMWTGRACPEVLLGAGNDVSGHPTECLGDTRTRGDLGFLTSTDEVFMFSLLSSV